MSKISGPLLDRIDIHIEVASVKYKQLRATSSVEDSAAVRQRVIAARGRQMESYRASNKTYANAHSSPPTNEHFTTGNSVSFCGSCSIDSVSVRVLPIKRPESAS